MLTMVTAVMMATTVDGVMMLMMTVFSCSPEFEPVGTTDAGRYEGKRDGTKNDNTRSIGVVCHIGARGHNNSGQAKYEHHNTWYHPVVAGRGYQLG